MYLPKDTGTTEGNVEEMKRFFHSLPMDHLLRCRQHYLFLLDNEFGRLPVTTRMDKKGRQVPIEHPKAPWMIEAWQQGMKLAEQVIMERQQGIKPEEPFVPTRMEKMLQWIVIQKPLS
jgi:hypothetical protein